MKTSCGLGFKLSRQTGYFSPSVALKISKMSEVSWAQARQEDGVQQAAAMLGWQGAPCWELWQAVGSCGTSPVGLLRERVGEFPLHFLQRNCLLQVLMNR